MRDDKIKIGGVTIPLVMDPSCPRGSIYLIPKNKNHNTVVAYNPLDPMPEEKRMRELVKGSGVIKGLVEEGGHPEKLRKEIEDGKQETET